MHCAEPPLLAWKGGETCEQWVWSGEFLDGGFAGGILARHPGYTVHAGLYEIEGNLDDGSHI